ncbi:MAG: hypothetical protein ACLUPV_09665 [Bilophila wadsworthia]
MRLATLVFPLVGIQIVVGNFFQSIGKAKLSIFLSLTRQLLFLAPCLLILPRFFELKGIWISLPVSDSLSFVTSMGVLSCSFGRCAGSITAGRREILMRWRICPVLLVS